MSATTGATSISSTDPGGGSATASSPQSPSAEVDGTVVDISIGGRAVTPTNAQAEATVGKPIVLKVSSDAKDQLHVHSVPERTFQIEARPDQAFEFTVDVAGQVDVELHDLNRTVVTIQVRP